MRRPTRVEARPPEVIERWPELISLVPETGRCLDVASGPGAVTLWFGPARARGHCAGCFGCRDRTAPQRCRRSRGGREVDALVFDLDEGLPDDLGSFDVIVCQRFRDPALYAPMIDRLAPAGSRSSRCCPRSGAPILDRSMPRRENCPRRSAPTNGARYSSSWEGDGVAHVVAADVETVRHLPATRREVPRAGSLPRRWSGRSRPTGRRRPRAVRRVGSGRHPP
jgi:hypothetical protein